MHDIEDLDYLCLPYEIVILVHTILYIGCGQT